MYIRKVEVKNFRNLREFQIELEPLTVITGPNNSGKSNLFAAIEKVLALKSIRNARINSSDFADPTMPIIIEVTFHKLSDLDVAAFHHPTGLINLDTNTLKIRLSAFWDQQEQDVRVECYFVRDDLPSNNQQVVDYSWSYRKHISHYFGSTFEGVDRELSFSQKQSFGKLIRAFAGDYLKPVEVLATHLKESTEHLVETVSQTPDELLDEEVRDRITSFCRDLSNQTDDVLFRVSDYTDNANESTELNSLSGDFFKRADQLMADISVDGNVEQVVGMIKAVIEQYSILQRRVRIQEELKRWSDELQHTPDFKNANDHLKRILDTLMIDREVSFQMLPIGDEQLISSVSALLGGLPISDAGAGDRTMFNLGLGLTEVVANEALNRHRSALTGVFIEEIERNLHPHMQRHMINTLRRLQEMWIKDGNHLQIILTTHSPSCLSRVAPAELIRLRSGRLPVKWSNEKLEELANGVGSRDSLSKLRRMIDRLFGNYSEALLSKVVVIVEGSTEQGFVSSLLKDIQEADYFGVGLVNAEGGDKIPLIVALLGAFDIQFVCIIDGGDGHNISGIPEEIVFATKEKAFEEELISTGKYRELLLAIDAYLDDTKKTGMIRDISQSFPGITNFAELAQAAQSMKSDQERILKSRILKWMTDSKTSEFGELLAKAIPPEVVPPCYTDAVKKALEIAKEQSQ